MLVHRHLVARRGLRAPSSVGGGVAVTAFTTAPLAQEPPVRAAVRGEILPKRSRDLDRIIAAFASTFSWRNRAGYDRRDPGMAKRELNSGGGERNPVLSADRPIRATRSMTGGGAAA